MHAQTQWQQINVRSDKKNNPTVWEIVPTEKNLKKGIVWEQKMPKKERLESEKFVWTEPSSTENIPHKNDSAFVADKETKEKPPNSVKAGEAGLRWPNGQLMSAADQIYYRSAFSRGSMIQIGETVYPNLGFNALQRHPDSWLNAAIVAIDDSRIAINNCKTGDFFDQCADGLVEARMRLWNSPALSFDLHWTMHSLSGEGSPFNFRVGDETFGDDDVGTKFGEGQSIGFVLSKNFGKTFGLSFAGYRLFHLDEVTDLPRNIAFYGTKVFLLNDSLEPPIVSISLGLMTDVYNIETNIGSVTYPAFLRGGEFKSNFAEIYGKPTGNRSYYADVAGVSSAFVCADQTVFAPYNGKKFKAADQADPNCIEQVYIGPIASIGFAPWPWLGIYAKYSGTDVDLGISLKPFKNIPWTFSLEALNPIKGVNPILDASYDFKECRSAHNSTFSDCRTRVGIFTELSF